MRKSLACAGPTPAYGIVQFFNNAKKPPLAWKILVIP
jgi:hypothetical protein